jgi:glutathione synthase/RimK-type ligase-like ATP-grasp enzyme
MSNTFLIVGKNFSSLKSTIEHRGDAWVLLKDSDKTNADKPNIIHVNFADENAVMRSVDELRGKIDGVIAIYENYIVWASKLAGKLGLPALPVDSARACTDKDLMRTLFLKSKTPISPQYSVVNTQEDILNFAAKYGYPLILKPANLAKSLLVLKCINNNDLVNNFNLIQKEINRVYAQFAPHTKPKIIIEEFLEGSIHSVDAFVDSSGEPNVLTEIVDYQTGYDIGFNDNFHYSRILPSKLSTQQQNDLRKVAEQGCRMLGMRNSAAHIEIIMTKKGPRIVEIGARNGGYRERMHKLANSIDVLDIQLDIKLGLPVNLNIGRHESVAVLELFPKTAGTFVGLKNENRLKELSSLKYYKLKQVIGSYVGKAGDGYKMCAVIILHNRNKNDFDQDLDYVNQNVSIITKS